MSGPKKLLLLGGLRYLLPVIDAAHEMGCHVITCDYIPDNIAHKYSDEYHNISILDKDAVLNLAQSLNIDGIMSFAVDPGVVTAAYVADKLGLPSAGPYESICILQNKDRFRKFLRDNGFNVPIADSFDSYEDATKKWNLYPCIVKPTDSAGSKGVSRVNRKEELQTAFAEAQSHSFAKRVIVEEFIEKHGCSSDSDSFSVNGKLEFVSFSSQHFDDDAKNPYTPAAYSWPSTFTSEQEKELTSEIQRLLTLLKMRTSIYNIETRIGTNGKPYIMEVSPRGGGNRLAEMIRFATGVDMISASVKAALGEDVTDITQKPYNGHWAEIILHAEKEGIFDQLYIESTFNKYVVEKDLWVKKGDKVHAFNGANDAIGTLVLQFNSEDQLYNGLKQQDVLIRTMVK